MTSASPLVHQEAGTRAPSPSVSAERTEPQPTATLRVLHVEDNPADALLAQEYLRGVHPSVEFDAAVRLEDVTAERAGAAHCAILDLSLPDASGLEALIAIRGMAEALPIIVLTGVDDLELAVTALRFGADDYLVKNDVNGDALQRAIRYSIERQRLRRELATELAATTIAAATVITVEAALETELSRRAELVAGTPAVIENRSEVLQGTHEVAVRIDDETGDYALRCRSCDWQAARGSDNLHSWAERSLDRTLLYHVDFGDLPKEESLAELTRLQSAELMDAQYGPRMQDVKKLEGRPAGVARRTFFSPARWIKSQDDLDNPA